MTAVLENELRWQSRRGTLELDLVLEKFWQKTGGMPEDELRALGGLLALEDEELRRKINGAAAGDSPESRIIRRLQNS